MNLVPIPRRDPDPHPGRKNVYACNVPVTDLENGTRPFADGTIIVKESIKENVDYPWLIATARKEHGQWQWDEYTRNFADEEFLHTLGAESICTDCHSRARAADWIFTQYQAR